MIVRDRALAQDLVQSAFVHAFERIDSFDVRRPFGPWFLKIVVNSALKASARRAREVHDPTHAEAAVDPGPGPERAWEQAETADEIWAALGELSVPQRAAVVQRWAATMAAALAVVLAGGTMLITSTSPAVNAEAILETAAALGDGPVAMGRTYHMTSTTTIHPTRSDAGAPIVQSQETWFGGGARMRQETRMPEFGTLIVNDGVQAWGAITLNGQTYAAPAGGVRFSDVPRLNPVAPEGTSIASLVATLRQAGCGTAEARGEQTVAERLAVVISVTHTLAERCGDNLQALGGPQRSPAPADAAAIATKQALANTAEAGPSGVRVAKDVDPAKQAELNRIMNTPVTDQFWIDKETFVVLRSEENYGPKGVRQYEVKSITYGVMLAPSTFQYTPPAGVRVLADMAAVKQALAAQEIRK